MTTGADPTQTASVFAVAADPERMRGVLAEHLRTVDGGPVEVRACEVEFARHGDARSLFQYRVDLADPANCRSREQAVSAITYGGGRTRGVWERLQKKLSGRTETVSGLMPVTYVPEPELLLQVFPFDYQMPALAKVIAGPWPELVHQLWPTFGAGDWRIVDWQTEVVRYRVDMRATVRLTVTARRARSGPPARRAFYVKVYANPVQAVRAWNGQQTLASALAAAGGPLSIAQPVGWLPGERVIVQRAMPGLALNAALEDPATAEQALLQAAHALAQLHQLPVSAAPQPARELGRVGPDRIGRDAARLRRARPDLVRRIDVVEAAVVARLAAGEPAAPIHGDLKPDHVLLDGRRVVLLDLDKFERGDPIIDVVNLARAIGQGRRVASGDEDDASSRAFIDAYLARAPAAWGEQIAPHMASSLLTEAAKLGRRVRERGERRRRDEQRDRVEELLHKAEAAVAVAGRGPGPGATFRARGERGRASRSTGRTRSGVRGFDGDPSDP